MNSYSRIIEKIFLSNFRPGASEVPFAREEIIQAARRLRISLPKNLGDVIYSFRFRVDFPESVASKAPRGMTWIIRLTGRARYSFVANKFSIISPSAGLMATKIPDATPGIIARYALSDEQALLAKVRYNRLVDVFSGVACYSLQSHLRTAVFELGQVETDEIYIGVDKDGVHYAFPIQAKGGRDRQSVVQIEQDFAICREKFPDLLCRPVAAQFMDDGVIALFEFAQDGKRIAISRERHYKLVPEKQLSTEELISYRSLRRPHS